MLTLELYKHRGGTAMSDEKKPKKEHLIHYANGPSLEEINGTVVVPKGKGFWRTLFGYSGPGAKGIEGPI